MPILHKIKAYLYDNVLTKDDLNDFTARTVSERSLCVKDICESAVTLGGADVSAAVMEHATQLFLKEMAYLLCDGYSVNTGYFTASTNIRGVFNTPSESFNPQKHNILFQFNQGEKLRTEIENIEVRILGVANASAMILQVTDIKTGTVNDQLTPGRNFRILGSKIKVDGDTVYQWSSPEGAEDCDFRKSALGININTQHSLANVCKTVFPPLASWSCQCLQVVLAY